MDFIYKRFENGQQKDSTDDSRMRAIGIEFFEQVKGLKFKNGTEMGIDLILIDNPIVGAEGENASWCGNRWIGHQADLFKLGVNTLNIQDRKWHYWNLQELSLTEKAKYWYGKFDQGWNQNLYFRLNNQEDQMCIVTAETILDDKKRIFVMNRSVHNNPNKLEDWLCVKEEFVETYNKQPDGEWILNGKYWGPTNEECFEIWKKWKDNQK